MNRSNELTSINIYLTIYLSIYLSIRNVMNRSNELTSIKCYNCPKFQLQYYNENAIQNLKLLIKSLKYYISNENLSLFPDYQQVSIYLSIYLCTCLSICLYLSIYLSI
jgi:hypothetical protein